MAAGGTRLAQPSDLSRAARPDESSIDAKRSGSDKQALLLVRRWHSTSSHLAAQLSNFAGLELWLSVAHTYVSAWGSRILKVLHVETSCVVMGYAAHPSTVIWSRKGHKKSLAPFSLQGRLTRNALAFFATSSFVCISILVWRRAIVKTCSLDKRATGTNIKQRLAIIAKLLERIFHFLNLNQTIKYSEKDLVCLWNLGQNTIRYKGAGVNQSPQEPH